MDIFHAIKNDLIEIIKEIIDENNKDSNLNLENNLSIPFIFHNLPPPISISCFYGSIKVFNYLLSIKCNINQKDSSKEELLPIHYSIFGNQIEFFEKLILNKSLTNGIIYFSCINDNKRILEYILTNKLEDILNCNYKYQNPLFYCLENDKINLSRLLLDFGIKFDEELLKNYSILKNYLTQLLDFKPKHNFELIESVKNGNFELFKNLIEEKKKDINEINEHGDNSFIMAAKKGFLNILEYIFLNFPININYKNNGGV